MEFLCWFLVFIALIAAIMLCPDDSGTRATAKREILERKMNGGAEKRRKKIERVDFDADPLEGVAGKVHQLEGSDEQNDGAELLDDGSEKVGFLGSQNDGLQVKDVSDDKTEVGGMDDSCDVQECQDDDAINGERVANEAEFLEEMSEKGDVEREIPQFFEEFERPAARIDQESVELEREVANCVDSCSGSSNVAAVPEDNGGEDDDVDDEEGWEGVERSELEKVFAEAVNYVEYVMKAKDSDLRMLLYGLHKLAVEGPCHAPQPMALMITARAKWNAWQRLGSMSPEDAMGEYIKVLSDADPGWKQHFTAESDSHGSLQTAEDGRTTS